MENKTDNEDRLINYLLGDLPDDEKQALEERYFVDDELYDELQAAERELVDRYVQGELSSRERERFESYFLSSDERRQKLRFARALRECSLQPAAAKTDAPGKVYRLSWPKQLFSTPSLKLAASIVFAFGLGIVIYQAFFSESQVREGLEALSSAYKNERPVEARISGFSYAPFPNTRGREQANIDYRSRDRAESILREAVGEEPGPESHHALGQVYLAKREFDEAIKEFEAALKTDPNNSRLHNDLGTALLEKAKAARSNKEYGDSLELLTKALDHFNKAMALDGSFAAPLFNRALLYEEMMLPQQARADWEEYLKRDTDSEWADEARRKLRLIGQSARADQPPIAEKARRIMLNQMLVAHNPCCPRQVIPWRA